MDHSVFIGIFVLLICVILFFKIAKKAVSIVILCILLSIMTTVFWGNGQPYVDAFSSLFSPEYAEEIQDAYKNYKEQDAQEPFLDYEDVKERLGLPL